MGSGANHAPSLSIFELWKAELFDGAAYCTRLLSPSLITKSKRNRKGTLTIERLEKAAKIQIDRESMATFFVCFLVCLVFLFVILLVLFCFCVCLFLGDSVKVNRHQSSSQNPLKEDPTQKGSKERLFITT